VRFSAYPEESFGHIEDEVGSAFHEPPGKIGDGFQANDLAQWMKRPLDCVDGGRFVPLGVEIGLLEIVPKGSAVGTCGNGGVDACPGSSSRRQRLEVEG
jgi:hypothetical protein